MIQETNTLSSVLTSEFYEFRERCKPGFCLRPPDFREQYRLSLLNALCPKKSPLRILELGAGGGQFAFEASLLGHHVTVIEIHPAFANHCKSLCENLPQQIRVIEADFFHHVLMETFDLVVCWDCFGFGNDDEQNYLLSRIASWLKPEAICMIGIFSPWDAILKSGKEFREDSYCVSYHFDLEGSRREETWYSAKDPQTKKSLSLRCYSPADLKLLIRSSGLILRQTLPGVSSDPELTKNFIPQPQRFDQTVPTTTPESGLSGHTSGSSSLQSPKPLAECYVSNDGKFISPAYLTALAKQIESSGSFSESANPLAKWYANCESYTAVFHKADLFYNRRRISSLSIQDL